MKRLEIPDVETFIAAIQDEISRTQKVLALTRIVVDPDAKILVTTALETLSKEAARSGLSSGANSLILMLSYPFTLSAALLFIS